MTENDWVVLVLWFGLLVLSQLFKDKDMRDAVLAIDALIGFVLAFILWGEGQAVVGGAIAVLNLFILFWALVDW